MQSLTEWAARWGVPLHALAELTPEHVAPASPPLSEAAVQAQTRLEAARTGALLWRNNVGAYRTPEGSWVRYGLANDSKALNKTVKSSDLIGLRPVVITDALVGSTIGQFVARETKRDGWKYAGTERELAQLRYGMLVRARGGDFEFTTTGY